MLTNILSSNTSPITILLCVKLKCNNLAVPFVSNTSSGCCSISTSISVLTIDIRWQIQLILGRRQFAQFRRLETKDLQNAYGFDLGFRHTNPADHQRARDGKHQHQRVKLESSNQIFTKPHRFTHRVKPRCQS